MANLEIIRKRFNVARKIYGYEDDITTPSGKKVNGRYLLTESGAVTPSHDPFNGFMKSDGFPTDSNGQTVNDRDYERDHDAQGITRDIAANYDSRALQTPVVVSPDGIVLSGNGRTMAGMLAARDCTDSAYISYLAQFPKKYGYSEYDIRSFTHPRLLFVTTENYHYTAETFAMFNAQDIKSQNKTEQAVKMGKLVDDATFKRIIRNINTFDTVSDFYANTKASTEAVNDLLSAGIISQMQYPEMFDGDSISTQAREILENVLIGKAFSRNADAVRKITSFKGVRRIVTTALAEISNNISLKEFSLERELIDAVSLCYKARTDGNIGHGEIVSGFARQMTMFSESATVADFSDSTTMMLADLLNHSQVTRLKKVFVLYNNAARESAGGQMDMFSGGVKTKDEILSDVKALFSTSSQAQLEQRLTNATFQRRIDAVTEQDEERPDNGSPTLPHGVSVGSWCCVILPSREIVRCKLERIEGEEACIRMAGWKRKRVPLSSLIAEPKAFHCAA